MTPTPTEPASSPAPDDANAGSQLPGYADTLRATHRAFATELRGAVSRRLFHPRDRVLDVPCGDGFYTLALARRLFPVGKLVAADLSDAFLDRARERFDRHGGAGGRALAPEFVKADVYHLPFADDEFDVAWCARSLISLDDPVAALREMRRVVRPGGAVAVLEDDEYHRVLLNWPVELELAVKRATAAAARSEHGSASKFSPARKLPTLFRAAGLRPGGKRTIAADRAAPFGPAARRFLTHHLRETRQFVARHLSPAELAAFDRFAAADDPTSVFRRPDAELTFLTTLFLARKEP